MSKDNVESVGDYELREPENKLEHMVLGKSRELFVEHGNCPVRMAIIEIGADKIAPMPLPRGPGPDHTLTVFREFLKERLPDATGVALVMETWGAKLESGQSRSDLPADLSELTPEQGRFEALTVVIEHRDFPERCHLWQAFITRDDKNEPTLGPWLAADGDVGGQSVGLMPPRPDR